MKDSEDKNNRKYRFRATKKQTTPNVRKKSARLASKAAREKCICQGEIAKNREDSRARLRLENKVETREKSKNTVKIPAKAEGRRTANSVGPKILSERAAR